MQQDSYRERLWAPASYWVIGLAFGLTFIVALGFYLGPVVGLASALLTAVLVVGGLLWYGGALLEVRADELRVADMRIEWPYVGTARALNRDETRLRLGRDADPAAKLLVRPYCREAVEIPIVDADDPHPYWLVSTRHPTEFAAAINARATGSGLGDAPHERQDDTDPTKE